MSKRTTITLKYEDKEYELGYNRETWRLARERFNLDLDRLINTEDIEPSLSLLDDLESIWLGAFELYHSDLDYESRLAIAQDLKESGEDVGELTNKLLESALVFIQALQPLEKGKRRNKIVQVVLK